jgi:uncharacterized protein (DUF885 family)
VRLAVALLWLACAAAGAETPSERAHALFDAYWEWQLHDNPRTATAVGDHRYDDRLQDLSEAVAKRKEAVAEFAKQLHSIDLYYVLPGKALPYKVGELRIKSLRAKAQTALGDRFDLRRFNNALIDDGLLPLSVLERRIDEWIARERG